MADRLRPTAGLEDFQCHHRRGDRVRRGEYIFTARQVGSRKVVGADAADDEFDALAVAQALLEQCLIHGETFPFEQLCETEMQVLGAIAPLLVAAP